MNEEIQEMENEILSFLRGNDEIIRNKILDKIQIYSDTLNFVSSNSLWLWCGGEAMNGVNTGIFDNNGEGRVTVGNDSFRVSLLHVGV